MFVANIVKNEGVGEFVDHRHGEQPVLLPAWGVPDLKVLLGFAVESC